MKFLNLVDLFFRKIVIYLIITYKKLISPYLGSNCRYYPSCSSYSLESFMSYNFFKAFYLSGLRIVKCNPFCGGGIDYPKKQDNIF